MAVVFSQNIKIFVKKTNIKTLNKGQFFFMHRTVLFIKGEVLINTPAKVQKTYENENG